MGGKETVSQEYAASWAWTLPKKGTGRVGLAPSPLPFTVCTVALTEA